MGFYDIKGIDIGEKARELLADRESRKALASIGRDGKLHVTYKGSLTAADGNIQFYELIETSQTNKNLIYSLWFGKEVAINVVNGKTSFLIRGVPIRAIVSGKEFEEAYNHVKNTFGTDYDLSTVWIIKPTYESEETFSVRQAEERENYPLIGHLDRYRQ